jgi:hypothetical protein
VLVLEREGAGRPQVHFETAPVRPLRHLYARDPRALETSRWHPAPLPPASPPTPEVHFGSYAVAFEANDPATGWRREAQKRGIGRAGVIRVGHPTLDPRTPPTHRRPPFRRRFPPMHSVVTAPGMIARYNAERQHV